MNSTSGILNCPHWKTKNLPNSIPKESNIFISPLSAVGGVQSQVAGSEISLYENEED